MYILIAILNLSRYRGNFVCCFLPVPTKRDYLRWDHRLKIARPCTPLGLPTVNIHGGFENLYHVIIYLDTSRCS